MASIPFPASAQPFLEYVKGDRNSPGESIFPTYAHLMAFAAAYGALSGEFTKPSGNLQNPNPIDLAIFERQGLINALRIIVLSHSGGVDNLEDENEIVKIVQGYTNGGFRILERVLEVNGPYNLAEEFGRILNQQIEGE